MTINWKGGTMKVEMKIPDSTINADDMDILKKSLGIKGNGDMDQVFPKLTKSAFFEYLKMFLENGMSHSADEVRQDRLYFLIQNYYCDRIPTEAEVSSIFQLTNSQSKTLLRNTISRYRTKIEYQIHESLRAVVEEMDRSNPSDPYEVVIESDIILEELNEFVKQNGPTLTPIHKKMGCACKYKIKKDTYKLLKTI